MCVWRHLGVHDKRLGVVKGAEQRLKNIGYV
jgi:hypothetical protein